MADEIFANYRLAEIYDTLDGDRSDLDVYVGIVEALGATAVLDIGCGTGSFACLLAAHGTQVTGVDPAAASLDVARRKPLAEQVQWVTGEASALASLQVDLVTMTGNVAQVLLTDKEWVTTLQVARAALRPFGWLVFETRDPARAPWREWNRAQSHRRVDIVDIGPVETWVEVTKIDLPLVSFRHTFIFEVDGATLTSDSTLRFRSRSEVNDSLHTAGFVVREVRDAPDRPGRELIFIATPTFGS